MNGSDTDPVEELLESQVRTGRFASRDEAFEWLRGEIKKGVDSLDAGNSIRGTPEYLERIKREGRERLAQRRRTAP